jgi:hypothetical protein
VNCAADGSSCTHHAEANAAVGALNATISITGGSAGQQIPIPYPCQPGYGFGEAALFGGLFFIPGLDEAGGAAFARLGSVDWADETGAIRIGRAPESLGGDLTEDQAMDAAARWLGPGYTQASPGRYVSSDGERVIRYSDHETQGGVHHIHFEALDNGQVVENTRVVIVR